MVLISFSSFQFKVQTNFRELRRNFRNFKMSFERVSVIKMVSMSNKQRHKRLKIMFITSVHFVRMTKRSAFEIRKQDSRFGEVYRDSVIKDKDKRSTRINSLCLQIEGKNVVSIIASIFMSVLFPTRVIFHYFACKRQHLLIRWHFLSHPFLPFLRPSFLFVIHRAEARIFFSLSFKLW